MNVNIEEMITLNYELEGLLYLALHRGNETPVQVWELISSKIENLREYLPIHDSINMPEMADEDIVRDNKPVTAVIEETFQETAKGQIADELDNPIITGSEYEPAPYLDEEIPAEKTTESSETEDFATDIADKKDAQDDECVIDTKEEVESSMTLKEENPEAREVEDTSATVATVENSGISQERICDNDKNAISEPMRLDEKLARENYRNLKKAFSLNDRFRFRRELFNNSDIEMTETLDTIQAMTSVSEALDYFYNDLGWDKANQDVIDFVDIVTLHFSGK